VVFWVAAFFFEGTLHACLNVIVTLVVIDTVILLD